MVKVLANGLEQGRIHHAFLFTGTRGVGKTTIARILAKSLNCERGVTATPCGECENCVAIDEGRFVDLLEIDAASRTKVDDTREILDNVQYAPTRGRYKVYLIDEVHMLSRHSFNALLKTLEEPPEHVKFLLATTDPQKIPVTILSRCLQFNLRRLSVQEISGQMRQILKSEGVEAEDGSLELLARAADGSMRDGLSLLDQALAGSGRLQLEEVASMLGSVEQRHVHELLAALAEGDAAAAIATVGEVFAQARGMDALLADLAEALHRIALVQQLPDYRDDSRADWEELVELASRLDAEDLQLWYQIAITGRRDLPLAPTERSGCEMTLLRMFAFQPATGGDPAAVPTTTATGASRPAGAAVRPARPAPRASARADSSGPAASDPAAARQDEAATPEPPATIQEPAPPAPRQEPEIRTALSADSWPQVLAELPFSDSYRTIAAMLVCSKVEQSRVQFLAASDDLLFMGQSFRQALEEALADWFDEPASVRIEAVDKLAAATPARLEEEQLAHERQSAEQAIEDDPFVQQLTRDLDAEVLPDSIRPGSTRSH